MADKDTLILEIQGLLESIQLDWLELASKNLTPKDRGDLRKHIQRCIKSLALLDQRLNDLEVDPNAEQC